MGDGNTRLEVWQCSIHGLLEDQQTEYRNGTLRCTVTEFCDGDLEWVAVIPESTHADLRKQVLDEVLSALENAYHPQHHTRAHPADYITKRFELEGHEGLEIRYEPEPDDPVSNADLLRQVGELREVAQNHRYSDEFVGKCFRAALTQTQESKCAN